MTTSNNDSMKNGNFFECYSKFVKKALSLLSSYLKGGEMVKEKLEKIYWVVDDNTYGSDIVSKPDYFGFIRKHKEALQIMQEYKDCLLIMQNDPILSKHIGKLVGTGQSKIRRDDWHYLSYGLVSLFEYYHKNQQLDENLLRTLYGNLEKSLYSDSIPMVYTAPLHNFESDVDLVDLGNGLSIRKITVQEKEFLLNADLYNLLRSDVVQLKYLIECKQEEKKLFENEVAIESAEVPDKIINNVQTTLRLYKEGIVGYNIISRTAAFKNPVIGEVVTISGLTRRSFMGSLYILNEAEIPEFRRFWDAVKKITLSEKDPLKVAIRRFNFAYERELPEDRIIDYMISYEALLFKEGETGELVYKLSNRVSRLLAQTFADRKRITKEIQDFYKVRSQVVHGETIGNYGNLALMESYLRRLIKIFLEKSLVETHDQIIEHLDWD